MNNTIFVIAEHLDGTVTDLTFEMLGKARTLADEQGGSVTAVLPGYQIDNLIPELRAADTVLVIDDEIVAQFVPQQYQCILSRIIAERKPGLVMIGSSSVGLDLAASLSSSLAAPMVASTVEIASENDGYVLTSQLYGGKIMMETVVGAEPVIAQILPGAFRAMEEKRNATPTVEAVSAGIHPEDFRMHFENFIKPETADIDITQVPILVSVGRGIQTQENIALAEELASALGGAVSSSRPVVDQDWLPVTRQVGKSGMTVKPRLYLALGISGAPEHVEGMKNADMIIAINRDPDAPIFSIADYGVVADLFDIVPALTERLPEHVS